MPENLQELLLQEHFDGSPIFNRAVEIVKALISLKNSHFFCDESSAEYDKKYKNMKVVVSQVLKGTRAASKEFILALENVIKNRLATKPNVPVSEVMSAFSEIIKKSKNKIFVPADIKWEFEELNEKLRNADSQITFAGRSLEAFNNEKSRAMLDHLITNMGFIDSIETVDPQFDPYKFKYEFHFSSLGEAFLFYQTICERLVTHFENLDREQIIDRLKILNRQFLKVYQVREELCVFRQIVFNHNSVGAVGFIIFTHGDNFSVAKMSSSSIRAWRQLHYEMAVIERHEIPFEKFESRFKQLIDSFPPPKD